MVVRILSAALLGAVVSTAGAATAAEPSPSADKKDEMVCTTETPLGSHLPKRTCMTRADREERQKKDREKMQRMHSQNPPKAPSQ